MGSNQSTPSTKEINQVSRKRSVAVGNSESALSGQKTNNNQTKKMVSNTVAAEETVKTHLSESSEEHQVDEASVVSADSSEYDSDFESDDEEYDEEFEAFSQERRAILADAMALKTTAEWFLKPENIIKVSDVFATARCYFDRASTTQVDETTEEERDMVLNDMKALKVTAEWFMHPEKPVNVTDAAACARCYFDRPSAAEQIDEDDADEEECIMQDLENLKKYANFYLHPEQPVKVDATACARNYFNRASAPINEGEKERQQILSEMAKLKKVAGWYMHPEVPVVCDDPCATGRNYFHRASAPDTAEDELECQQVLAEAAELKKVAEWHLHPEAPLEVSSTACACDYFARPSAPEYEEEDYMDEREQVLAEAAELKKIAEWYHCPEKPVEVDATACARNYFNRASAPINEEERERQYILKEAAKLKKVAEWYHCPEKPVEVDASAGARNYFHRASAPDTAEDELECQQVLAEAAELKKVAGWYLHPEAPLEVSSAACARDYFSRPSAPEYEEEDYMDEHEQVLAEAAELKKIAEWYHCPEKPVEVDATACARNYFNRASAPINEEERERQYILKEAAKLKKVAEWYHCPEKPVEVDASAGARNYFHRASAPDTAEDDLECQQVLADAAALKKVAGWYQCPEKSVEVDSLSCARCYFDRASAPTNEEEEERQQSLTEAAELKKVAEWYMHPETPVTSSVAVTRNHFSRPSAPTNEDEEECAQILAEASELKKLAMDYLHPELPVESSINCVRNYFDRASAPGHVDQIHTEGRVVSEHGFLEVHHFDDHHHYHEHDYGHHHDDHSMQSDHFEMEEDQLHGFRDSMIAYQQEHDKHVPIITEGNEKYGGNLSRSPSDVMLFEESAM